jgi:hypothetical protein
MADDLHPLIRRLIAGDPGAGASLQALAAAEGSPAQSDPTLLVAAALAGPGGGRLLVRAAAAATITRDRQLVAIAAAHLADHPGSLLAAWIAAQHPSRSQ